MEQSKHLQGGKGCTEKHSVTLFSQGFNMLQLCMAVLCAELPFQAVPAAMGVAEPHESGSHTLILYHARPCGTCFQL